jgi:hypothetical protein
MEIYFFEAEIDANLKFPGPKNLKYAICISDTVMADDGGSF